MKALYPLICFFALLSTPLFGQLRSTMKSVTPFDPATVLTESAAATDTAAGDVFEVGSGSDNWDLDSMLTITGSTGVGSGSDYSSLGSGAIVHLWTGASFQVTLVSQVSFGGASSQHLAAQAFFDAYKAHDVVAARAVANGAAISKLSWDTSAEADPSLVLADDTHIVYDGGSIELKMVSGISGRSWMVDDVVITTN